MVEFEIDFTKLKEMFEHMKPKNWTNGSLMIHTDGSLTFTSIDGEQEIELVPKKH
ncbi:hypothetical protein LCGC14_0195700 [marine sediment metagenome]|uniref:Uncharacterized protein n=1 Tax=marine sediment metagenome TaxID=412755 RepID=A0A0F9V1Z0_9ZZZZ